MQQRDLTLASVRELLHDYHRKHRAPGKKPFEPSGLYELFPEPSNIAKERSERWPAPFPNCKAHGVYLILDADQRLLYIGKASMMNRLGNRLATYFATDPETAACCILGDWSSCHPRFVATIPVDDDLHFEAAALEEFLIAELGPPLNKRGRRPNS